MDVSAILESQEMVPGGDLRFRGNEWLRHAWESVEHKIRRVPREGEVRKIVAQLVHHHHICVLEQAW